MFELILLSFTVQKQIVTSNEKFDEYFGELDSNILQV